jgi:hypothetical protein
MAVRLIETDFGTKDATLLKITEIMNKKNSMFEHLVYKYWQSVYYNAIDECPKDTGALSASIRIRKAGETTSAPPGPYGISLQARDFETSWYITAGGAGIVNPKHKREVDYAQAVHEGYKDASGRFHPPNRFLERAFQKSLAELWDLERKIGKWYMDKWREGAITVPPSDFYMNIPVGIKEGIGIYK